MGVTEVELSEVAVAVGGPFASELPIEDKASVLGVTELKLVVEAGAAVLVISATPTELAAGEPETEEGGVPSTDEIVLEAGRGFSAP